MDDYEAAAEGTLVRVRGTLRKEADVEHATKGFPFSLQLRAPCLFHAELTPRYHMVASATPIDEERTWLWVRKTQSYVPAALGGRLLAVSVRRTISGSVADTVKE